MFLRKKCKTVNELIVRHVVGVRTLVVMLLCFSIHQASANRDSTITTFKKADYYIDDDQQRIDKLDGEEAV